MLVILASTKRYNNQFKRDSQRLAFLPLLQIWCLWHNVWVGWRRCSPLNWALAQNFATTVVQLGEYEFWLQVNIKVSFLDVK